MHPHSIIIWAASFCLCALLTPLFRQVAIKHGWVARPSDDRWHTKTTALMGGVAIFIAVIAPLAITSDFSSLWRILVNEDKSIALPSLGATLCIGASILFLLGLFDDYRHIKPQTKLVGQIIAASLVAFLGFRLHWFNSLTLDTMATLFWIVGITNAFNLIDNMDGLCAGVGMVAAISLAFLFYPVNVEAFHISLIFAGATAGFLIYNFNPAKIFMGDCGSLVIGFSISVLTLSFSEISTVTPLGHIAVPILVLLVPILDTSLVTIIRLLSGRKASTGGRDHTSHRLVLLGFSEKSAVLFLYGVGAISGLAACFVSTSDNMTSPTVIIPMGMAIVLMGIYLSQLRVYPEKEFSALREKRFTPVLIELTYKRQLIMVLLDFVIVAFAYYLSYRLRFGGPKFSFYFAIFFKSLPAIIGCKLLVFYVMGVYRGIWSYISTNDVFLYLRATVVASLLSIALVTFIYRFEDFSKGVFFIDWVISSGLLLAVRGSFRLFIETQKRKTMSGEKVIIYGAGRGGELLLREIINNPQLQVKPLGFVDDNPVKKGKKIHGYPILGTFEALDAIYQKSRFDGVLISFNGTSDPHDMGLDAVKRFCDEKRIFLKQFSIALHKVDTEIK